jgi:hypothetical protein
MSKMIGGLSQVESKVLTSDDKMLRASESIREMEKNMNTGLMWMTEAIHERCRETDRVDEENKKLLEQNKQLKDLMGWFFLLNLIVCLIGIGTSWYICS